MLQVALVRGGFHASLRKLAFSVLKREAGLLSAVSAALPTTSVATVASMKLRRRHQPPQGDHACPRVRATRGGR
jgi:hypothetical protein